MQSVRWKNVKIAKCENTEHLKLKFVHLRFRNNRVKNKYFL